MKKLLLGLLFLPVLGYSQKFIPKSDRSDIFMWVPMDTLGNLVIENPLNIKGIKVGDKIYRFNLELKEVPKPEEPVFLHSFIGDTIYNHRLLENHALPGSLQFAY